MESVCKIERSGIIYNVYELSKDELEQLNPTEQELFPIVKDIEEYCDKQSGFSYNNLKTYIFDTNNYIWKFTLKKSNIRGLISLYLRDKRKNEGVKYMNSYPESERLVKEVEERYLERGGQKKKE